MTHLQSTTNYDQFRLDPRNREVNQQHVNQLAERVQANNLLHLFPIIVGSDGVIRDGQHRREVARQLGVALYYIVSDDMKIEDVPIVTKSVKQWTPADILSSYCAAGLPEYLALRGFMERYPFLTVSRAAKMCHIGGIQKDVRLAFENGTYTTNNIAFAEQVCEALLDFEKVGVKFWNDDNFWRAITSLLLNPDYDHSVMMSKMERLSTRLVKCPDTKSYITVLGEIYNDRARSKRTEFRLFNRSK